MNDLNPLGFVSREFNLIKKFILISLALEYLALMISCNIAILMFHLTQSIAVLINRITLDRGRLWNRKKPAAEVMRMGALLASEDAV